MAPVIRLLGRPEIIGDESDQTTVRGHQAWALLARILLSDKPLDRRSLAAELFPDAVDPLGSLRWCLAALRRAIGSSETLTGDPVRIDLPEATEVDVLALRDGKTALPDQTGDLLEGIEPRCSAEFSTWLLIARERIAATLNAKLRQETLQAISSGDFDRAIRLSEQAVRRDAYNEGAHILLVKSLTHAGSIDAAMRHIEDTTRMFEAELGVAPSPALRGAARKSVSSPPAGIAAEAVVKSLLESGKAALAAGATEAGIDCLRRAVTEAEASKDRWLQSRAMQELGVALVHSVRGYDDEGAILIRQSIDSATDCSAPNLIATGYRELGYVDALAGRRPEAAGHLDQADAVAQDADARAGILSVTGFNLVDWGKVGPGLDRFEASLEQAREAQNRRREIWSLGIGAWGQLAAGDLDTAQIWLDQCIAQVAELNWLGFRPWPLTLQAEVQLRLGGRPDKLRDSLFETFALSCQIGDPCWEAAAARAIALTYASERDLPLAIEWLEQARKRCTRETDHYAGMLVNIYADHADLCLQAGRAEQANALARELLSLAARTHMDSFIPKAVQIIDDSAA
jgi:DNA-binding SARP family transcriptional activator